MTHYWISTEKWTVEAQCRGITIMYTAPLTARFIGQPIGNLLNWARQFGGLRWEKWESEPVKPKG